MLCIGKWVGSLSMYGGGFGCSNVSGVVGECVVLVVLCVHYDLVFYIRSSRCLVSRVLSMGMCSR
jgi:hypothetical protein